MTRTPHDSFAKDYLEELLSPLGKVETSREISDEPNHIDVLFSPDPSAISSAESIGLLGRLVTQTSSIEVFRNQPNIFQLLMCMKKLYNYFAELNRQANREGTSFNVEDSGKVLIISTTVSQDFLEGFGATINSDINCNGVYSLHKNLFALIIAVNQLPVTDETLWLRVLGKGKVQRRAVEELLELPDSNQYKESTLRMIANLRIVTIKQTNLTEEDQETVMNLSTAYVEWEQKTLEQGELIGELKLIIRQLNRRFGEITTPLIEQIHKLPLQQLEELAEALLDFSSLAHLEQWLKTRPNSSDL